MLAAIIAVLMLAGMPRSLADNEDPMMMEFDHKHDFNENYHMEWTIGEKKIWKLRVKTLGWVAFGLHPKNPPKGMKGADIIIGGVDKNGKGYLMDTMATGNRAPVIDASQDVTLLAAEEMNGYTTIIFTHSKQPDVDDIPLMPGEVGVIWAYGAQDINGAPSRKDKHAKSTRGKTSLVLLRPSPKPDVDDHGHDHFGDEISDHTHERVAAEGKFHVRWQHDNEYIMFELTAETTGWLGIGLSPEHEMDNADIVMCWYKNNKAHALDTFALANGVPSVDASQDIESISGMENATHTTVKFKRKLVSTDEFDRSVTDEKTYLIWAFGTQDIDGQPVSANYHLNNRGYFKVNLLDDDKDEEDHDHDHDHDHGHGHEHGGISDHTHERVVADGKYVVRWQHDDEYIMFELTAETTGWLGVGLSPEHEMDDADIIMCWYENNKAHALDTFAFANGVPTVDASQDIESISGMENDTHTTVRFKRKLLATNEFDRSVTDEKTYLIWAFGTQDVNGQPASSDYHFGNRGYLKINLLDDDDMDDDHDDEDCPDHDDDHDDGPHSENERVAAGGKFHVRWEHNDQEITFELIAETTGWLGIGLSPEHEMDDSDIIMCWYKGGQAHALDTFALFNGVPDVDVSQDIQVLSGMENETHTMITFKRLLVASNEFDRSITDEKTYLIWAFGTQDIDGQPVDANYHDNNRGYFKVNLLDDKATGDDDDDDDHDHDHDDDDDDDDDDEDESYTRQKVLAGGKVVVQWGFDDEDIWFETTAETLGWFGIGFAPERGMTNADIIMCGFKDGKAYAYDTFAFANVLPTVDASQGIDDVSGMQNGTHTTVRFERHLMSRDPMDRSIMDEMTYLIWAFGSHDLIDGPHFVNYHFGNRGASMVNFIGEEEVEMGGGGMPVEQGEEVTGGYLTGEAYLDDDETVLLKWKHDRTKIEFELSAPTTGWVGLGFSPGNNMAGADIIFAGADDDGGYIVDAYAERNTLPKVTETQDVTLLSQSEEESITTVKFERSIVPGDQMTDMIIMDGEISVIWAYGTSDLDGSPNFPNYHRSNRGAKMLEIIPKITRASFANGKAVLDADGDVILQWSRVINTIYFQMSAPTTGWVGLGFSPGTNMKNADMVMGGLRDGLPYIFDCWAPRNTAPRVDKSQDATIMAAQESTDKTVILFQRPVMTDKENDRNITPGMMNVIWAFGGKDVVDKPKRNLYHRKNKGWTQIELIPM